MNEQRPDAKGKPEAIEKKDQQVAGQGDKLQDAVDRVAAGTKPERDAKDLKADEVME